MTNLIEDLINETILTQCVALRNLIRNLDNVFSRSADTLENINGPGKEWTAFIHSLFRMEVHWTLGYICYLHEKKKCTRNNQAATVHQAVSASCRKYIEQIPSTLVPVEFIFKIILKFIMSIYMQKSLPLSGPHILEMSHGQNYTYTLESRGK